MNFSTSNPLSLGAVKNQEGLSFSLLSQNISSGAVHLFRPHYGHKIKTLPLHYDHNGIWKAECDLYPPDIEYIFEVDQREVLDPYAKALSTPQHWGVWRRHPRCQLIYDHTFDFEGVPKPGIPQKDLIIYEMHVRGFTHSPSSGIIHPGTFLGILEKIPYLKSLGVNAIELLPIFEFDETENSFKDPTNQKPLANYWGYSSMNFFAPMKRYATKEDRLSPLTEFKTLVRELHKNGIEIILDVVYNHVSHYSGFNEIDRGNYFILSEQSHTNFTGCGNTFSANSPSGLNLILASLYYFAEECQVDGFRFDLGGALTRDPKGNPLKEPPLFKAIDNEPRFGQTKFFAEPWDCGSINFQNGFPSQKVIEWDGDFKRVARQFIHKAYENTYDFFHTIFPTNPSRQKVHYITCHDGFSLRDLVSYNTKHNERNGEDNRDGDSNNVSYNYGVEGKTDNPEINLLRETQMRNFLFINLLSFGIPMITMGDEYGLSHDGNNNPYCHDDPINWINWDEVKASHNLLSFTSKLIALRKGIKLPTSATSNLYVFHRALAFLVEDRFLLAFNPFETAFDISGAFSGNFEILLATNEASNLIVPKYTCLIACRR